MRSEIPGISGLVGKASPINAKRDSLEYFRHQWRSVKKYCFISVKNKTLFERSEFVLFRKWKNILASQRKPAFFLCFVSFVRTKEMKALQLSTE